MDSAINLLMSFLSPKTQAKAPLVSPLPKSGYSTTVSSPSPSNDLEQRLQKGFAKFGKGKAPPIATKSAQLAELGKTLPKNLAAFPAALTLKETGGLSNSESARRLNNPVGLGPHIQYPNLDVAILGGGNSGPGGKPQLGLKGVLSDPRYKQFMNSGNLVDFIRVYSPHKNKAGNVINPTEEKQIQDFMYLMSLFQ